jgi:hypothetical protein
MREFEIPIWGDQYVIRALGRGQEGLAAVHSIFLMGSCDSFPLFS